MPLGMVDDIIAFSQCGHKAVELNAFITTQCEIKKLRFHVPDEKGKTKCHQIHVGKDSVLCPTLKIHGYNMEKVSDDKYLGDILSADGKNSANLKDRIGKGLGIISEIMSILDSISFGFQYFRIFNLLRESMFINGILTNTEVWYGVGKTEFGELEELDRMLIRRALKCQVSTPKESYYLELGLLPIQHIIKARRINYLHYILTSDENAMLYKFFKAQYESPVKEDWTEQVRKDLKELNMTEDVSLLKTMSEIKLKTLVKKKIKEHVLECLNEEKLEHSKMENLVYTELKTQDYLLSEDLTTVQKRLIFLFRTRMADYSENFRGTNFPSPCKICGMHVDSQSHSVICFETIKNVKTLGNYNEIFLNNISRETAIMLEEITEIRKNKI